MAEAASDPVRQLTQSEILQIIFDHIPVMISFHDPAGRIRLVNRAWERIRGWSLEELLHDDVDVIAASYPELDERQRVRDFIAAATGTWAEFRTTNKTGAIIDTEWASIRLSNGTSITIGQDITARKHAEAEQARLIAQLRSSEAQLQALSRQLLHAREDERAAVARELHDEIAQVLAAVTILIAHIRAAPVEGLGAALDKVEEALTRVIGQIRDLSLDLRPALLNDLGLAPALSWYIQRLSAQTSVQIELTTSGLAEQWPMDVALAAYRIVEAALANVTQHAGTPRATVRIWTDADQRWVEIADDGDGFDVAATLATSRANSLVGMREHAAIVGGSVTIESAPARGTRVTARFPR